LPFSITTKYSILALLALLQTRLLEDTIERAGWHVHSELSSNRNGAGLASVLKLPVATLRSDVRPAILLQHPYDFAYFHQNQPLFWRGLTIALSGAHANV
jgi:hypothetical protein